jgi:hypothetical protein
VLLAFQAGEPETRLVVVPADSTSQERTYSTINPQSKNVNERQKIEQLLSLQSNGSIQGNVTITSKSKYSTIKKNHETKKLLLATFKISTNLNNIQANNITEVGFFTHHLVRDETAECNKWITELLPPNTPPFQTEIVTVWAGPSNERKVTGALKVFSDQCHVNTLANTLRERFNDKHKNMFITKEYYDTLDIMEKKEYISER